jgi:hypothetical protein
MHGSKVRIGHLEISIYAFIAALLAGRFFTETVPILPRIINVADLLIVPLLLPLCLLRVLMTRRGFFHEYRLALVCAGFAILCLASWLSNISDVHWIAALVFIYGLIAPFIFFWILRNAGLKEGFEDRLLKLLVGILIVNLGIGFIQAFVGQRTDRADFLTGTFGLNQNQMAFFIAVMVAYFVSKWRYSHLAPREFVMMVMSVALFLLCFFQTLWIVLGTAMVLALFVFGKLSMKSVVVLTVTFLVLLQITLVALTSGSFAFFGVSNIEAAIDSFDSLGKVNLIRQMPEVFSENWWTPFIGVGPGTFNSRGFQSIAILPYQTDGASNVAAAIIEPFYTSAVASKYVLPTFRAGGYWLGGSHTFDAPFTSYISVPVESGLLGALLVFGIYANAAWRLVRIVRRSSDPKEQTLASWALMAVLMLLGISLTDNCLEVTRYTMIVWLLIATSKIYSTRGSDSRRLETTPARAATIQRTFNAPYARSW